jgi:integrase/recombinase XerD
MSDSPEKRLIDPQGRRLYLTGEERAAFMEAARRAPREVRTLCTVLHDTGCRISEALELVPARIDLAAGAVTIRTLKKRRQGVYRAVPVAPGTLSTSSTWCTGSGTPRGAAKAMPTPPCGAGAA